MLKQLGLKAYMCF